MVIFLLGISVLLCLQNFCMQASQEDSSLKELVQDYVKNYDIDTVAQYFRNGSYDIENSIISLCSEKNSTEKIQTLFVDQTKKHDFNMFFASLFTHILLYNHDQAYWYPSIYQKRTKWNKDWIKNLVYNFPYYMDDTQFSLWFLIPFFDSIQKNEHITARVNQKSFYDITEEQPTNIDMAEKLARANYNFLVETIYEKYRNILISLLEGLAAKRIDENDQTIKDKITLVIPSFLAIAMDDKNIKDLEILKEKFEVNEVLEGEKIIKKQQTFLTYFFEKLSFSFKNIQVSFHDIQERFNIASYLLLTKTLLHGEKWQDWVNKVAENILKYKKIDIMVEDVVLKMQILFLDVLLHIAEKQVVGDITTNKLNDLNNVQAFLKGVIMLEAVLNKNTLITFFILVYKKIFTLSETFFSRRKNIDEVVLFVSQWKGVDQAVIEFIGIIYTRQLSTTEKNKIDEIAKRLQQFRELLQEIVSKQQEVKDLKIEKSELKSELKQEVKDLKELKQEVKDLKIEKEQLEQEVKELKVEKSELEQSQKQVETQQEKLLEREAEKEKERVYLLQMKIAEKVEKEQEEKIRSLQEARLQETIEKTEKQRKIQKKILEEQEKERERLAKIAFLEAQEAEKREEERIKKEELLEQLEQKKLDEASKKLEEQEHRRIQRIEALEQEKEREEKLKEDELRKAKLLEPQLVEEQKIAQKMEPLPQSLEPILEPIIEKFELEQLKQEVKEQKRKRELRKKIIFGGISMLSGAALIFAIMKWKNIPLPRIKLPWFKLPEFLK